MAKDNSVSVLTFSAITSILKDISPSMYNYVQASTTSKFSLYYKFITHSDLAGGKRTSPKDPYDKNILYYLTVAEMHAVGTPTAHQSNILVPANVYYDLGIVKTKGRVIDFKLVNDTVTYFCEQYTKATVTKLGKVFKWDGKCDCPLSDGNFTDMQMTVGDQGIGRSDDVELQTLRRNIFVNDTIYFLVENKPDNSKQLFVMLEKNPKFFEILKIEETPWKQQITEFLNTMKLVAGDEDKVLAATRKFQAAWRKLLAKEMMNYIQSGSEVICPFTLIRADFEKVPQLFIASHIKAHSDSDMYEKYNPNNGLLLCANADALFDDHMITVSENKDLLISKSIDDQKLIDDLLLNHDIFKLVLNEERMEFMKYHREKFEEKERQRQGNIGNTPSISPNISLGDDNTPSMSMVADDPIIELSSNVAKGLITGNQHRSVLVGCYKNIKHKKWILQHNLYNVRLGNRKGALGEEQLKDLQTLLLYQKSLPSVNSTYTLAHGRIMTGAELIELGYPGEHKDALYYIYEITPLAGVKFDIHAIMDETQKNLSKPYIVGTPIIIK